MKKITDKILLAVIKLVTLVFLCLLSFEIFMDYISQTNPEKAKKIDRVVSWKIDADFKNDPNNIWYETPKK